MQKLMNKLVPTTNGKAGIGPSLLPRNRGTSHQPKAEAHGVRQQHHGRKQFHGGHPKFTLLQLPKLLKNQSGRTLRGSLGHLRQHHQRRGRNPTNHGMSGALGGSSE